MSPHARRHDALLQRVRGEFFEMPGLRLTEAQARRLWGIEPDVCATLLQALVDVKFLIRTAEGIFVRAEHVTRYN
jgi:hypothetical protein